jgi:hypothetical protein
MPQQHDRDREREEEFDRAFLAEIARDRPPQDATQAFGDFMARSLRELPAPLRRRVQDIAYQALSDAQRDAGL